MDTPTSIKTFWPIFIAVIVSVASYAGTTVKVGNTEQDVKQIQQTYVTREIMELTLKPIQQGIDNNTKQLERIEELIKKNVE